MNTHNYLTRHCSLGRSSIRLSLPVPSTYSSRITGRRVNLKLFTRNVRVNIKLVFAIFKLCDNLKLKVLLIFPSSCHFWYSYKLQLINLYIFYLEQLLGCFLGHFLANTLGKSWMHNKLCTTTHISGRISPM
jgi:hypothetical protein